MTTSVSSAVRVERLDLARGFSRFLEAERRIYANDRCWVPPVEQELREMLGPSYPFWSHAERRLYVAFKDGRPAGRIASIRDDHFDRHHNGRFGFFGFFESEDDPEIASALLEACREDLRGWGCRRMIGPVSPSTNDICGVLIEGFDRPPAFLMGHNPPYYDRLLRRLGLRKAKDLYAWDFQVREFPERVRRIIEKLQERRHVRFRPLNKRRWVKEVLLIGRIYNDAWRENWGFVPLTEEELRYMARKMRPLYRPGSVQFAEVDGEPVGVMALVPDVNEFLLRIRSRLNLINKVRFLWAIRRIRRARLFALGVAPAFRRRGIEALLYARALEWGFRHGYRSAELSWTLEDNRAINDGIRAVGGRVYKVYRLYETLL